MKHLCASLALVWVLTGALAWADNSPGDPAAILNRVSLYGNTDSLTTTIAMKIATPRGTRDRTLKAYVRRSGGETQIFIQMTSPAFLSSMKFLSKQKPDGAQTRWIGTSRGVRRVANEGSSDEHLFDSDFTVEDLSSMSPHRFRLSMLPETTLGDHRCYAIEASPRFSGAGYDRKVIYVDRTGYLLVGMDYFTSGGRLLRRYRTHSTQEVDGTEFPRVATMTTPGEDSSTTLTFERVESGRAIPARIFNIGNL